MSGNLNIDQLEEILACEIECGIFEKHVAPALEVARKVEQDKQQNTQQPVAWVWQFEDGEFYETPHHTKEECERDCCGYDGVAVPCFTAPPVPRDVLMAFGEAVKIACVKAWGAADECDEGNAIRDCDIAAIADRYASQVQAEPEPVNHQLLSALKAVERFNTPLPHGLLEQVRAAIAAAEAAQPVVKCATCQDSGVVGHSSICPNCEDTWQPASAQPVALLDERCPHCFGSGVMPKAAIAPEPPDVSCRNCNGTGKVRAMLSAAPKPEGV